jgi:transcriptional regulator with XRE-family HTH domain
MNDETTNDDSQGADPVLGPFIRQARQAAGLELQDLAREIRISKEFLTGIESGQFENLPADAYIRGYLNSIALRLNLDAAKLIELYQKERSSAKGSSSDHTTSLANLSSTQSSSDSPLKPLLILFSVLIIVWLGARYWANIPAPTPSVAEPEIENDALPVSQKIATELIPDTLMDTTFLSQDSLVLTQDGPELEKNATLPIKTAPMATRLSISCIQDSSWIQIHKSGKDPWGKMTYASEEPLIVTHFDTVKVSIGVKSRMSILLDGKKINIDRENFIFYGNQILP